MNDPLKKEPYESGAWTKEREREEYKKLFSCYSKFITDHPKLIGEMRNALQFSARAYVEQSFGNRRQFPGDCRKFGCILAGCECGEIDPKPFTIEEKTADANSSDTTS